MDKPKSKLSYKRQKFIEIHSQELFMQIERCSFEERIKIVKQKSSNQDQKIKVKYEFELVKKAEKNPKIFYKYLNSQQTIRD